MILQARPCGAGQVGDRTGRWPRRATRGGAGQPSRCCPVEHSYWAKSCASSPTPWRPTTASAWRIGVSPTASAARSPSSRGQTVTSGSPPHFHVLQLDGLYAPGRDGGAPIFHPAPGLTQEDVEAIVERASKRILRFLQRRGAITLVTAPGDGEVTVVGDETMGRERSAPGQAVGCGHRRSATRWPGTKARPRSHHARPRRPPGGQGQVVRATCRVQPAWSDQGSLPTTSRAE
jgi:hypothetical protein